MLLFLIPRPHFWKKRVRTFDEEINAELVGNNLSSPKWKTEKIICPFLVALFMFFLFSGQFWTVETPSKSVLAEKLAGSYNSFFFYYQLGYTFFYIRTNLKLKNHVTTVYLLQYKTNFLKQTSFKGDICGKLKKIYYKEVIYQLILKNLVFRWKNLIFRGETWYFDWEIQYFDWNTYFFVLKIIFSIEKLSFSNIELIEKLNFSIEIPSLKKKLSFSKILRFQMIDSCFGLRNEIVIPMHAEDL